MTLADSARELVELTTAVEYHAAAGDAMGVLRGIGLVAEALPDLAGDAAQAAYNAGATKKAMAAALGVPASTFRGMARQVPAPSNGRPD